MSGNCVTVGDFNDDGELDLATGSENAISVALGNGDGSFGQPINSRIVNSTSPATISAIVAADFNGDGQLDLAVLMVSANQNIVILLGNGDGSFRQGAVYMIPNAPTPTPLISADFNGDGHADLAFVSVTGTENNSISPVSSTAVSVMIGNGDGTFSAPANYADLQSSEYLAVGDFNGDGIPDLLTLSGTASALNTLVILEGVGDGTFASPVLLATGLPSTDSISGLIAADLNQDGRTDVAMAVTTSPGSGTAQSIAVF